jgi:hypothetical protein
MLSIRLQTKRKQTSRNKAVFQFPYPVPDPADLPPPSTAEQFFAYIAMLLLFFSLVLWLLPAPFSRRILRIIFFSGVWPFTVADRWIRAHLEHHQ